MLNNKGYFHISIDFSWLWVIILCLVLLFFYGCAATKSNVVEIPIAVAPSKIVVPPCPERPMKHLTEADGWDIRLKAWWATIMIQESCIEVRDKVIDDVNK